MRIRLAIIACIVFFLLVIPQSIATAQGVKKQKPHKYPICKPGRDMPDLVITDVVLKKSDYFTVTVKNIGLCAAPVSQLGIYIGSTPEEAKKDTQFMDYKSIPALKANQSYSSELYLYGSWGLVHNQKYSYRFWIDFSKKIEEMDEYNNQYLVTP